MLLDAKKLKKAIDASARGRHAAAHAILDQLARESWIREASLFELVRLEASRKNWDRALHHAQALNLLRNSPSLERRLEMIAQEAAYQSAIGKAKSAKGVGARKRAVTALQDFYSPIPYKQWPDREEGLSLLLDLMKKDSHPLLRDFFSELLAALPQTSTVRRRVFQEVKPGEISALAEFPRLRFGESSGTVKAVQPDQDLFDKGMELVLREEWLDAEELFVKLTKDFPDSEHSERARYWIGRMLQERGLEEEAKARFQEIAARSPLSWYGTASAVATGLDLRSRIIKETVAEETVEGAMVPRQRLTFLRAQAFLDVGLLSHARDAMEDFFSIRPAGWAFGQNSAPRTLTLARLYAASGYHLGAFGQGMSLAEQSATGIPEQALELLFPRPFSEEAAAAEKDTRIPKLLLWSLMKQESGFLPHAVSRANAIGLTQVLPLTAKEVDPTATTEILFQPEHGVRIGARYLRGLLDRFEGNASVALSGYNAGPTRAAGWFRKFQETAPKGFRVDAFVDTIPFTETRKYVGTILRNLYWYRLREGLEPPKNLEELAQIWPKDNNEGNPPPSP